MAAMARQFELAPVAFAVTGGTSHELRYANVAFRRLQAAGDIVICQAPPDGERRSGNLTPLLNRAFHRSETIRDELLAPPGGPARWSCTVWPIAGDTPAPQGLVMEVRDVTYLAAAVERQRVLAERLLLAALREQDAARHSTEAGQRATVLAEASRDLARSLDREATRYRLATTAGGVAVWDWTLATDKLSVDAAIHAALGFAEGEIGTSLKAWQARLHPDDADRVSAQALSLIDGTTPSFETEYRMLHRDGGARWFFARGTVVSEEDGSVRGLIGTLTDITARKWAEESVRESEERTSMAANAARLGFWQRDLKTGVMWLSEHARRLYGLAPEVPVTSDTVYGLEHIADRDRTRAAIDAAIVARSSFEVEFRIPRPNGETVWLNMQGRPRIDDSGTATDLTGVLMDVTQRKELALAEAEEHKELAHLGRVAMIGELSTALAHELSQPLTAILGNAHAAKRLLATKSADIPQLREIVDDIVRDDLRAAEVIRQLRRLIRNADSPHQPLGVSELAREALSIVRSVLLTRGVVVTADFPPSLPAVMGDRLQLLQVLLNLILNACDAMEDTPVVDRRVTLSARVDEQGDVVVSVADRGTGIAKGRLERVFEPFVTTKAGGLGLGLAICRSIVNVHDGRLWATDNLDHGAVFHLALPTRPPVAQELVYPKGPEAKPSPHESTCPGLAASVVARASRERPPV